MNTNNRRFQQAVKTRVILFSILAGVLCFLLAPFNLNYTFGPLVIHIPLSLIFPAVISFAYRFRGALITAFSGASLFPFYIWPNDGLANIGNAIMLLVYFLLLAEVSKQTDKKKPIRKYLSVVVLFFVFTTIVWLHYMVFFNHFLALNKFLDSESFMHHLDKSYRTTFFFKDIINYYLIAFFAGSIVRLPEVRRFLRLPVEYWMKKNSFIFISSLVVAFLVWSAFFVLDYFLAPNDFAGDTHHIGLSFLVIVLSGGIIGRVLIYQNESKLLTEGKLKENRKQLQNIISNIPSAIYRSLKDPNRTILMLTSQFENLFGYATADVINNKNGFIHLVHPEDQQKLIDYPKNDNPSNTLEYRIVNSKGDVRWILDKFIIENSTIDGIITDITEKKQKDEELQLYRNKLEDLVKEKTINLETANRGLKSANKELHEQRQHLEQALQQLKNTQQQLIESEKMASIGTLTAGVAHEINNPLNFVYNGTAAIKNKIRKNAPETENELKPLFDAIEKGVKRITDIVKSLGTYSRSSSNTKHTVNVKNVIDECLTMLHYKYKNRVEIKRHYEKDIFMEANEGQLHQAAMNILSNAIQAIEGKGVITIHTRNTESEIMIEIADNGIGINPEHMKKIFDPFFTTKPPGHGTGLGLSITRKIVEENGGSIYCESEEHRGTLFRIVFPLISKNSLP